MIRNDPSGVRRKAIQQMHDMVIGAKNEKMPLTRFLAMCSYTMGLTRKTSITYLQDLKDLGFIEFNVTEDTIWEIKP